MSKYRELTDDEVKEILSSQVSNEIQRDTTEDILKLEGKDLIGIWWTGGMSGFKFEAEVITDDNEVGFCDEGGVYFISDSYSIVDANQFPNINY